ncbi:LysE family transporter [Pseudoduganella namucuonensis]|uniref:Threonine/homoserine/homoserine lactone efflux protein n=1 Tax=Pseudoduganella namucuonensis TaxID=1035707 RepID=A0A1I7M5N9_9BURK|nr:LysE family transporter [Pseudoduganella namucuonensis]SFV17245.1 Threonine/homoserine/homoserine lactone efflux protein [Pseudoduganella namucuonensis]
MSEVAATLARGAMIGFAIAAPVGPIGLLCIRRTFAHGASTGLASGLGAAVADAMYGLIAALGVSAVASLLLEHASTLRIVGGALMAVLGVASLRRAARTPAQGAQTMAAQAPTPSGLAGAFGSTFALTASSPMTILSFAGLLAALAPPDGSVQGGLILVAGVFTGSIAWWVLLVGGVAASRRAIPPAALRWIEGVSGVALLAFAVWSLFLGLSHATI